MQRYVLFFLAFHLFLWGQDDSTWSHAMVSAYAVDMRTGEVIANIQGDKSLVPSSCMKIVTTAAALHLLGPENYFQTTLEVDGDVKKGVLQGNLWIRGGGDPCLGSDRIAASLSWEKQIAVWAEAVEKQGIKVIQGGIRGDASRWEKAQAVPSWEWEDLGNYYGAGASALTFHENAYEVYFTPGSHEGEHTIVKRVVPAFHLAFENEVLTGPVGSGDRACIYGSEYSTVHYIRGTIPAGVAEFSIKGSIPDPIKVCTQLLAEALQRRGIQIQQKQLSSTQTRSVIQITTSPEVHEIAHWTNQRSINLYAEHLLKSMGEKVYGEGSTVNGVKAVLGFWQQQGIDLSGLNMVDGSGLSRKNFITAKQFVSILTQMKKSPHFPLFLKSLPEESPGVRAKPGSMSFVRGCVGYKGDIAFAILINHCPDGSKMKQKLDQFIAELP